MKAVRHHLPGRSIRDVSRVPQVAQDRRFSAVLDADGSCLALDTMDVMQKFPARLWGRVKVAVRKVYRRAPPHGGVCYLFGGGAESLHLCRKCYLTCTPLFKLSRQ